jgi:hypothetical protein
VNVGKVWTSRPGPAESSRDVIPHSGEKEV